MNTKALAAAALTVRSLSMDGIQKAASGHPGLPLGAAELAAVLYGEILKHNPADPNWINRDRFVLSAGHGSMFLYSMLYLSGYNVTLDDIKNFRQAGCICAGHPEYGLTPGVETTTGPLGQGIATAVGMAIAESMAAARFNTPYHKIIDHYTYVLVGEGCLMEGISSEASSLAGHLRLGKLIVFYDENRVSIDGSTDITFTEDIEERYKAYGWQVLKGSMYDMKKIVDMVEKAKKDPRPSLIMLNSVIGKGCPPVEGLSKAHGAPLGEDGVRKAKINLGLNPDEYFYVDPEAKEYFEERKKYLAGIQEEWNTEFKLWQQDNPDLKALWDQMLNGELTEDLALPEYKVGESLATRVTSGAMINEIAKKQPSLVGGSADLTGPNQAMINHGGIYSAENRDGRFIYYGIREAAMAAISNGLQLYGFFRSYCATFLVFADYLRPALRLSALMKQPVIYVLTHDSIYVGEDGPTHQPVETLTSLRMIPGVTVLRPGDAEETVQAWKIALENKSGPTCLILSRQNLSVYEKEDPDWDNTIKCGAYIVKYGDENPDTVILATGSEVSLALEASALVPQKKVRVVSVLSREIFASQPEEIKSTFIPKGAKVVSAEAGITLGWEAFTGSTANCFGINRFGISAPGKVVAQELGFTAQALSGLL